MSQASAYQEAARAYTDGVRTLFTQPAAAITYETHKRGAPRDVPADDLATQAEQLVPLSAGFTRAAAAQLNAPDPMVRADTASQLLTKALTDLQISAQLLQAAMDEETASPATRGAAIERRVTITASYDLEENLRFLSSAAGAAPAAAVRGVASFPADVPAARAQLAQLSGDTLTLIRDRAGKSGQTAISGLLVLGVADVARAAGVVGLELAAALGMSAKVTRLYSAFREFALNAYNSLVALLGPTLAQTAAQQALAWVNDVVQGQKFSELLEKLYETGNTGKTIDQEVNASQAALGKFVAAIQGVDALGEKFGQQIGTIDKLLKGLRLFGAVPTTVVPQGKLLVGAAYVVIGSYVVLAGADFVDAPNLRWLDRVPGVRRVVETNVVRV